MATPSRSGRLFSIVSIQSVTTGAVARPPIDTLRSIAAVIPPLGTEATACDHSPPFGRSCSLGKTRSSVTTSTPCWDVEPLCGNPVLSKGQGDPVGPLSPLLPPRGERGPFEPLVLRPLHVFRLFPRDMTRQLINRLQTDLDYLNMPLI